MSHSVTTDLIADGSFNAVSALRLSMGTLSDSSRNNGALAERGTLYSRLLYYLMRRENPEQGIGKDVSLIQNLFSSTYRFLMAMTISESLILMLLNHLVMDLDVCFGSMALWKIYNKANRTSSML